MTMFEKYFGFSLRLLKSDERLMVGLGKGVWLGGFYISLLSGLQSQKMCGLWKKIFLTELTAVSAGEV